MKLRTIMKGGGVFTQQSVRLSNFQIKIRFAGTCSWKRGNWLRLGSLVTFFGLGFHFMICTTLTKKCVYWWQRCTYDVLPPYVQLRIYSIATCVGKSLVKRIETCFFAKRIFTTNAAAAWWALKRAWFFAQDSCSGRKKVNKM